MKITIDNLTVQSAKEIMDFLIQQARDKKIKQAMAWKPRIKIKP